MKVVAPFSSIDITKGKAYNVIKDFGFGDVIIKNDAGEEVNVATAGSAWTYYAPWTVKQ